MTGRWPPVDRSRSRIAWITWNPSSFGMWTSRSSKSKTPSFARASACRPLFASRTRWPRRASSRSRSCALISLSSATRMCRGAAAGTGAAAGSRSPRGPGRGRGVAVGPAHHPVDRLEELVLLDRLEQVGVDPLLADPVQVAGAVPRGQQDDPRGEHLGPLADLAASARPSVSGMRASSRTSAYGRPTLTACQSASRAASPSPTAAGSICQPRSHSSRMCRLVALSSTISTGRSWSRTGGRTAAGSGGAAGARTAP